MQAWLNKIWLPLVILALAAVYFEANSIKTVELDAGYGGSRAGRPQVGQGPQRARPAAATKSRLAAGQRFASLEELVADQQAAGYLKTGYFGKFWPATVAEIKDDRDGIVFIKRDGTRHTYSGFEGYRMRMVRLTGGGDQETIVIFRSTDKHR